MQYSETNNTNTYFWVGADIFLAGEVASSGF